jgi:DNA-binding response OmpR family regulator
MEFHPTIIFAEDEIALATIVIESLESRNFGIRYAENGRKALELYRAQKPDLLVLDVMMPVQDGFSVAREIRVTDKTTPIIFLTSKSQTSDVLDGFSAGGNDYLKKPFSMEELIVRINALLDRTKLTKLNQFISIGAYEFNHIKQELRFEDTLIRLTHREAELLFHLAEKRNEILDRSLILKKIWGEDDFFSARSMDVFISKLRKKLKMDPAIEILNVRGYGYKLICEN